MAHSAVSIIAPVYNGEDYIVDFIEGIRALNQNGLDIDLVIVDNGSTDQTTALIEDKGVAYHQFPFPSVYSARNFGVTKAKYSVLAFIDSDCVPSKDWVIKGTQYVDEGILIAGLRACNYEILTPIIMLRDIENKLKLNKDLVNVNAGNFFILKSDFELLGGFQEEITTAGDSILSIKARLLGMKIEARPNVKIYESPKLLYDWLKFNKREAYGSKMKSNQISIDKRSKTKNFIAEIRSNLKEIFSTEYSLFFKLRSAVLFLFLRLHAYWSILISKLNDEKRIR